jgi:3-oxocholest-4-en-26-oyl-CoA dehydrogenase beta subunit
MNATLDDNERELQTLARQILSGQSTHERLAQVEQTPERFDRGLWSDLADAGLLGAGVAEDDGGLGLGVVGAALVAAEVGRAVAAVPYDAAACAALVLARHGSPAQKERWLASVVSGTATVIVAPPLSSLGLRVEAGRVTGTAVGVPWAHVADAVLVLVGEQVLLVQPGGDGVASVRGETTARQVSLDLTFDDVRADPVGDAVAARFLAECWLTLLAATQGGVTDAAVRMTASYTSEREQFGKPLSTFQGVALAATDAYVDSRAIDAVALQAAWSLDVGVDATLAVLTAAWWASDGGQRCVHRTQHLHGGIGADITYPLHRYFLWGKQIELMCGAASSLLADLGEALAARPLAGDAVHL